MTRINCIPVTELHDKHLKAEYYELPRVFKLVRRFQQAGGSPETLEQPEEYVLGKGHVKFFYTRLLWLSWRHVYLVNEMKAREYRTQFKHNLRVEYDDLDSHWWGDWEPTAEAMALNRARIEERLRGSVE